jgi:hypothetical protein
VNRSLCRDAGKCTRYVAFKEDAGFLSYLPICHQPHTLYSFICCFVWLGLCLGTEQPTGTSEDTWTEKAGNNRLGRTQIGLIKSKGMAWVGHVARTNDYILICKTAERQLVKHRYVSGDDNRMNARQEG